MIAMHCHAMSCLSCMSTCSNTLRCLSRIRKLSEAQSEISCKVSERLQRLPKRLLRSEMMEVLLPGETRLEVGWKWKFSMRQNLQQFFLPFAFLKRVRFLLHHAKFSNYSRLKIQKTKHVVDSVKTGRTKNIQQISSKQSMIFRQNVLRGKCLPSYPAGFGRRQSTSSAAASLSWADPRCLRLALMTNQFGHTKPGLDVLTFMIPLHFCMMWSCLKLFESCPAGTEQIESESKSFSSSIT